MKYFSCFKKYAVPSLASLALFSGSAMAAPPDFSGLTDSLDFSSVGVAIMAIAAAVMGLYVIIVGVKKVIKFVQSS